MAPNPIELRRLARNSRVEEWLSPEDPNNTSPNVKPENPATVRDLGDRPVVTFGAAPEAQDTPIAHDTPTVQDSSTVQNTPEAHDTSVVQDPPAAQDTGSQSPGDQLSSLSPAWHGALLNMLLLALFLSIFEIVAIAPAIPIIASDLNTGIDTSWIGSSFFAAMAVFQFVNGRLAHIIGHRYSLPVFLVLMSVGNIGCASCSHKISLFGFRSLAGIGGGGVASAVATIATDLGTLGSQRKRQCAFRVLCWTRIPC
jgi:hypothetical protein